MTRIIYKIIPNKIILEAREAIGYICMGCGEPIGLESNCRKLTDDLGWVSHDNDVCFNKMLEIREMENGLENE